jgi:uncharacterized glyoxalase superfamily protein PhnB
MKGLSKSKRQPAVAGQFDGRRPLPWMMGCVGKSRLTREDEMVDNPPAGVPRITPYLLYQDVDAALDFMVSAFGFDERVRLPGPDGKTMHAEAGISDGLVMMGCPGADYKNPRDHGAPTQLVSVYVEDVDAHCAAARSAGAKIVREPADQFYGDRTYGAEDPEGHQWSFAQHVRDVSPEEMRL